MMATSKYKKDFMIFPQRKSCDSMNDQNRVTQYMDWVSMEVCMMCWGLFNTT